MTLRWNQLRAPRYSREDIVGLAEGISIRYADEVGKEQAALGINFDALFENVVYPEKEVGFADDVDIGNDAHGKKVLGEYLPVENQIVIDKSQRWSKFNPAYRRAFTCAHEVGHLYLHRDWFLRQIKLGAAPRISVTGDALDVMPIDLNEPTLNRLEIQANIFAAHMLVPTWLLSHVIVETFGLRRGEKLEFRGRSKYCLGVRNGNHYCEANTFHEFCRQIAATIQFRFGWISKQVLAYRVEQSSLITDATAHLTPFRFRRALAIA